MDITSLKSEIKTPDSFTFCNRTILFSKISAYDEHIKLNIQSKTYANEYWPSIYIIKYYFNIICDGHTIELESTAHIFPKSHKVWKTIKLFGFIPIKWKVFESDFWEKCSLHPTTTELEYLKSDTHTSMSFGEWFAIQAGISNHYNFIYNTHTEFINKFNEWKKENA